MAEKLRDSRPIAQILEDVTRHFEETSVFKSVQSIVERFLQEFKQDPLISEQAVLEEPEKFEEIIGEDTQLS